MNREEAIELFLNLQHDAGFERRHAEAMADEAETHFDGQSTDYGDGYSLAKTAHGWDVQVGGFWFLS